MYTAPSMISFLYSLLPTATVQLKPWMVTEKEEENPRGTSVQSVYDTQV